MVAPDKSEMRITHAILRQILSRAGDQCDPGTGGLELLLRLAGQFQRLCDNRSANIMFFTRAAGFGCGGKQRK